LGRVDDLDLEAVVSSRIFSWSGAIRSGVGLPSLPTMFCQVMTSALKDASMVNCGTRDR
jgi:hypothetical protein